ncbi:FAD binding domain protein [Cyathus striatus]|nr:FAD binding domain protein [Cyathus striatus]
MVVLSHLIITLAIIQRNCAGAAAARQRVCKVLPKDPEWPSAMQWNQLNATVEGRLLRTVPPGRPCHDPDFNEINCANIRAGWVHTRFHLDSPTSIDNTIFTNNSCNPFTQPNDTCLIGVYPQYSVNVSKPRDVIAAVHFSREHDLRFVIKNTGHDSMGKNIGTGSLSVWMHNLQERIWLKNYSSPIYTGPAVKVQAGVVADALYQDAAERGYTVVAGTAPTVGVSGGYIQGGGHSLLTNLYGMAADQALEYDVITTKGKFIHASPAENQDLFWAISGGGGTSYGIVWSVTIRVFPDTQVTTGVLTFTSAGTSAESYWNAISVYQRLVPSFIDEHAHPQAVYNQASFSLTVFAPNCSGSNVSLLFQPIITSLNDSGMPFNLSISTHPNFRYAFLNISGPPESSDFFPSSGGLTGASRLVPRDISSSTTAKIGELIRKFSGMGGTITDIGLQAKLVPGTMMSRNSVLPAWRTSQRHLQLFYIPTGTPTLNDIRPLLEQFRSEVGDPIERLTPTSGAYLNEADPELPSWKHAFYGINYNRLLSIKDRYDPDSILYGITAVGGDRWVEDTDGRLCKKAASN